MHGQGVAIVNEGDRQMLEQARTQAQELVRAQLDDADKPFLDDFVQRVTERASTDWQLLRSGNAGRAREITGLVGLAMGSDKVKQTRKTVNEKTSG